MNRTLIIAACAALSLSAAAGSKTNPGSRARLRGLNFGFELAEGACADRQHMPKFQRINAAPTVGAFITLSRGSGAADLEALGIDIRSVRGTTVLARLTSAQIAALDTVEAVEAVTVERPVKAKMDIARSLTGIDRIHTGDGIDCGLTGQGVLAGIVDGGFDPNHINFRDADGNPRIRTFTYFRSNSQGGYITETYQGDQIAAIKTDNETTFHGTHTLGIMAGSYKGTVTAASYNPVTWGVTSAESANPYYGVATGADIAIAANAGSDYLMSLGMEEILNYAYYVGATTGKPYPVVINLSLGTNVGPHDGSSTISRYIDAITASDEVPVVVCVSAGNEGDLNIAANKTLSAGDNALTIGLGSLDLLPQNYPRLKVGQVYIYSDSAEPFDLKAFVYNRSRGREALQVPLQGSAGGGEKYFVTSSDYATGDNDVVEQTLARYFTGYLGVAGMLDTQESGRYMAVVDLMLWDTDANKGNYEIGFTATGRDGQRLDVFTTGEYFDLSDLGLSEKGFTGGTPDGSISDVATGRNVVVVGSYNQRDMWASLDGNIYGYQNMFADNLVSGFSSYGTLVDGRSLPTVCAPGATVISSSNEYYLDEAGAGNAAVQAAAQADGRRHSWHQCVGTSMSSPLVAGAIALWLEANPELRYDDVLAIIRNTATVDDDVLAGNPVQWGAGKFDAYAGLLEAIRLRSGITAPEAEADIRILRHGDRLDAVGADSAVLHSLSGTPVRSAGGADGSVSMNVGGLQPGVYILSVNGGQATQRVLIK